MEFKIFPLQADLILCQVYMLLKNIVQTEIAHIEHKNSI
jgi:hypothetical protein